MTDTPPAFRIENLGSWASLDDGTRCNQRSPSPTGWVDESRRRAERRQVTTLFPNPNLNGSSDLLADRDHEEARELLNPVFERMTEALHHERALS